MSREVELTDEFDNTGPVVVTMKTTGVEMRMKGTSRTLFVPWEKIGSVAVLPGSAPARHAANPMGWLVQK